MKKIIAFVVMFMFLSTTVMAIDPSANFRFHRKYSGGTQGVIWFDHDNHVKDQGRDCDLCHLDRVDVAPNIGYVVGSAKGHTTCRICHDDANQLNGFTYPENSAENGAPMGCGGGYDGTIGGSCHGGMEP